MRFSGLFHKAICQSGVALNPWAQVFDPKKYAYKICELLGKNITDHKEIVQFLRTIHASKLIEAQEGVLTKEVSRIKESYYLSLNVEIIRVNIYKYIFIILHSQ